jgi:hypothetical protein
MFRRIAWLSLSALLFTLLAAPALCASDGDRVQIGQSITIAEDETAGSVVCIGCSIHMEGTCADVVAIGGSIVIDGQAKGDAVAIGGGIQLGENASVAGDLVSIGGRLWRHPNATVKGTITQSGTAALVGLMLGSLLPVILIVALIVWLLSRNRPAPVRA